MIYTAWKRRQNQVTLSLCNKFRLYSMRAFVHVFVVALLVGAGATIALTITKATPEVSYLLFIYSLQNLYSTLQVTTEKCSQLQSCLATVSFGGMGRMILSKIKAQLSRDLDITICDRTMSVWANLVLCVINVSLNATAFIN